MTNNKAPTPVVVVAEVPQLLERVDPDENLYVDTFCGMYVNPLWHTCYIGAVASVAVFLTLWATSFAFVALLMVHAICCWMLGWLNGLRNPPVTRVVLSDHALHSAQMFRSVTYMSTAVSIIVTLYVMSETPRPMGVSIATLIISWITTLLYGLVMNRIEAFRVHWRLT